MKENWIQEMLTTKKLIKEGALDLSKETREEVIKADYARQIKAISDSNLAEKITELELQGKGLPELFTKRVQETMKKVKSDRKASENRLKKLLGNHSALEQEKIFEGLRKKAAQSTTLVDFAREVIKKGLNPNTILLHIEARKDLISPDKMEEEMIELNAVLSDMALRQSAKLFYKYMADQKVDVTSAEEVKKCWNNYLSLVNLKEDGEKLKAHLGNDAIKEFLK